MAGVPIVDLGELGGAAEAWDDAMCTAGFAVVINHGLDADVRRGMFEASRRFFLQRTAEEKKAFCFGPYGNEMGGFTPAGMESVARTLKDQEAPPDRVESYVLRRRDLGRENMAKHAPELAEAATVYFSQATSLLQKLHVISARALGVSDSFFDHFYDDGANLSLRLAFYPKRLPNEAIKDGQLRYGAHCDYEGFTILALEDDKDDCLEVFLGGKWTRVTCPIDALIVNVGELMTTWSNYRWTSTLHRVMNRHNEVDRFSIPFFTGPNPDTMVVPIGTRGEGIRAHDHLMAQLKKSNI